MNKLLERLEAVPRIVWPLAFGFLMAVAAAVVLLSARSAFREEAKLIAELERHKPFATRARAAVAEHDHIHRIATELNGWETTRLAIGDALTAAARIRPTELTWNKLVLQQQMTAGSQEAHLAYRPRTRETRLVLSGTITARNADLLARTYLEALNETNLLGSAFGKLTYPSLARLPAEAPSIASYTYTMEGRPPPQRIDRRAAP